VQWRAAKQHEVVQARAACSKKRAVAKIPNIEINWSYKQGRFKQQWDKPLSWLPNMQLKVAAAGSALRPLASGAGAGGCARGGSQLRGVGSVIAVPAQMPKPQRTHKHQFAVKPREPKLVFWCTWPDLPLQHTRQERRHFLKPKRPQWVYAKPIPFPIRANKPIPFIGNV
jgi:hypothetical protein